MFGLAQVPQGLFKNGNEKRYGQRETLQTKSLKRLLQGKTKRLQLFDRKELLLNQVQLWIVLFIPSEHICVRLLSILTFRQAEQDGNRHVAPYRPAELANTASTFEHTFHSCTRSCGLSHDSRIVEGRLVEPTDSRLRLPHLFGVGSHNVLRPPKRFRERGQQVLYLSHRLGVWSRQIVYFFGQVDERARTERLKSRKCLRLHCRFSNIRL